MGGKPYPDIEKYCAWCNVRLHRHRYNGVLESNFAFKRRKCCSASCGSSRRVVKPNTNHWRARKHLKDGCEECGATEKLHVHHKDSVLTNNEPSNLETLCVSCHISGHWARYVPKPKPQCNYCDAPSRSHKMRMCQKHYSRYRRHGSVFLVMRANKSGSWLEVVS